MKKVTLLIVLLLSFSGIFAQTYTTGTMSFFGNYTGKIDVTNTTVTVTLIGPSTNWLGIGFDATSMDDVGKDVVIFDGTSITDRSFNGIGVVPPTDTQNWTLSSNVVNTGVRTVVMTRSRSAAEGSDYAFPLAAQPINIIYAQRVGSTTIGYHGGGNCGTLIANLTLSNQEFSQESFKIFPNPSNEFLTINFPQNVEKGEVKIYDSLGKVVKKQEVTITDNTIHMSDLKAGSYTVVLRTDYGNATKTLLIN